MKKIFLYECLWIPSFHWNCSEGFNQIRVRNGSKFGFSGFGFFVLFGGVFFKKFNFGFCTVVKFEVQFILVWYIINWKWEKTHRIRMVFFKRYKPHRYSRSSTVVHTAEANSTQFAIFETMYPLFIENRHIVSMHVYLLIYESQSSLFANSF